MPKKKSEDAYKIDTDVFFEEWHKAVSADPPLTMAELCVIMQRRCDSDPKNAGLEKDITESVLEQKMNYYRRSYGEPGKPFKMKKPKTSASKTSVRDARRTKWKGAFAASGSIEPTKS
jgi:hypothetical protein